MAQNDTNNLIVSIKEIYIDFIPKQDRMFSFEFPLIHQPRVGKSDYKDIEQLFLKRCEETVFASLLSLRLIPNIRYSTSSPMARKMSERILMRLEKEYTQSYKDFKKQTINCLFLDRRDDLITPLIYNWSYMSLVDEFLGIENGAVKVSDQVKVFSLESGDTFIQDNWDKNYGEFTMNLSQKIEKSSKGKKNSLKMDSLEDLKKVIDEMPDMKRESNNIKKHSEIIGEVISNIQNKKIYDISELQQDIAVDDDKGDHYKRVMDMITDEKIGEMDKIKISMLFCLKYYNDDLRLGNICGLLRSRNISTEYITR